MKAHVILCSHLPGLTWLPQLGMQPLDQTFYQFNAGFLEKGQMGLFYLVQAIQMHCKAFSGLAASAIGNSTEAKSAMFQPVFHVVLCPLPAQCCECNSFQKG